MLVDVIRASWRSMSQGEAAQKIKARFDIAGQIRSTEITHGDAGAHPHLHVLFAIDRPTLTEDELEEFRAVYMARWAAQVHKRLGRNLHAVHGVDARMVTDAEGVGDYLNKIHFEMVRSDLKTGRRLDETKGGSRTPWQVAIDGATTGDARDIAWWRDYCIATKGLRVMGVSKALWDRYGRLNTTERSDEELAAENQGAEDEVAISNDVFGTARTRRDANGRSIIARAVLALEDNRVQGMADVLAEVGDLALDRRPFGPPLIRFRYSKAERLTDAVDRFESTPVGRRHRKRQRTELARRRRRRRQNREHGGYR